jgi:hypothetical protein
MKRRSYQDKDKSNKKVVLHKPHSQTFACLKSSRSENRNCRKEDFLIREAGWTPKVVILACFGHGFREMPMKYHRGYEKRNDQERAEQLRAYLFFFGRQSVS